MVLKFERSSFRILVLYAKIFISFYFVTYFTTELRCYFHNSSGFRSIFFSFFFFFFNRFVYKSWKMRMYNRHEDEFFESKCDPEERRMFSTEFKSWCGKLTFAISKQRLTLAGQEIAALGEKVPERPLLVRLKYWTSTTTTTSCE